MKKRSVLMTVLAMILVAVISVGSTLAYLTATDEKVVNTFHFGGMTVTLTEDPPSTLPPNATVSPNKDGGYDYKDITPNSILEKNPKITTDTDVDAYLFIKVSGATDMVKPCDATGDTTNNPIIANNWKPLVAANIDGNFNGVYYREVIVADGDFGAWSVFEQVKVADKEIKTQVNADGSMAKDKNGNPIVTDKDGKVITLDNIQVEVYEIQKNDFASVEAAFNATPWGAGENAVATPAPVTGA